MLVRGALQEVHLLVCMAVVAAGLGCASARAPEPVGPTTRAVPAPPPRAPLTTYVVRPGDTLGRIAMCSGASVTELAQLNRVSDPNLVLSGARLRVPVGHRCVGPRSQAPEAASADAPQAPRAARVRANRLREAATARQEAADFEGALSKAEACVSELGPFSGDKEAVRILARCHLVAGMAAAGLDRRDRAIEEFRQAFALDPGLKLAPEMTSPRILDLASAAQPSP